MMGLRSSKRSVFFLLITRSSVKNKGGACEEGREEGGKAKEIKKDDRPRPIGCGKKERREGVNE